MLPDVQAAAVTPATIKGQRRQRQILELLHEAEVARVQVTLEQLAAAAACSRQRVSQVVDDLEDAALITKAWSYGERWTAARMKLTPAGLAKLAEPRPIGLRRERWLPL